MLGFCQKLKDLNYECIIIDDGSTDKTSRLLDDYAGKYSTFKVTHKENGGVSAARNLGLHQAKGDKFFGSIPNFV